MVRINLKEGSEPPPFICIVVFPSQVAECGWKGGRAPPLICALLSPQVSESGWNPSLSFILFAVPPGIGVWLEGGQGSPPRPSVLHMQEYAPLAAPVSQEHLHHTLHRRSSSYFLRVLFFVHVFCFKAGLKSNLFREAFHDLL